MLTDELWSKLWPILSENDIYDKPDIRHTVEAILYKMRVGCPWRDLPQGCWDWKKFTLASTTGLKKKS
jgi:transposase